MARPVDSKPSSPPNLGPFSGRPEWVTKFRSPSFYQNRRPGPVALFLLLLACLGLGFGGGWLAAGSYENSQRPTSTSVKQRYISDESQLISQIAQSVGQSVVSIDVESRAATPDAFGFLSPIRQQSSGTGFIVSSDGVVLTNRHVVPSAATHVSITLADGTRYDNVKIIGRTSENSSLDIAFLKIADLKDKKLTPVKLGDSSKIEVGERVIAIGNALGQFQNTVTSGIISGYGRDVVAADQSGSGAERLNDLFQTDAAINEGNSGGPLVNINGEVIGINTAVAGGAQNIGFAIPINDAKGVVKTVLEKGKLEIPFLGVVYVSLSPDLAFQYNLTVKRGAYIPPSTADQPSIVPGSPAEKAGVREKDIIIKVGAVNVNEKTSLTGALASYQPGQTVTLTIIRDGKTMTVRATLAAAP